MTDEGYPKNQSNNGCVLLIYRFKARGTGEGNTKNTHQYFIPKPCGWYLWSRCMARYIWRLIFRAEAPWLLRMWRVVSGKCVCSNHFSKQSLVGSRVTIPVDWSSRWGASARFGKRAPKPRSWSLSIKLASASSARHEDERYTWSTRKCSHAPISPTFRRQQISNRDTSLSTVDYCGWGDTTPHAWVSICFVLSSCFFHSNFIFLS